MERTRIRGPPRREVTTMDDSDATFDAAAALERSFPVD